MLKKLLWVFRKRSKENWGPLPDGIGLDATGILEGLAAGELRAVLLLGADPVRDHPSPALARRALERAEFSVAFDLFLTDSVRLADVVLPVAGLGEVEGTATNLEGRVQKVNRLVPPAGTARPAWSALDDIAAAMGASLGAPSAEALAKEIAEVAPAYGGITWDRLAWGPGREGIVLPHADGRQPLEHIPLSTGLPSVAGGFVLHLGRVLYDDAVMTRHTDALRVLAPTGQAHLHPEDAARIGIEPGDVVAVIGEASIELPVALDPSLAVGTVYVPFNLTSTAPLGAEPTVRIEAAAGEGT